MLSGVPVYRLSGRRFQRFARCEPCRGRCSRRQGQVTVLRTWLTKSIAGRERTYSCAVSMGDRRNSAHLVLGSIGGRVGFSSHCGPGEGRGSNLHRVKHRSRSMYWISSSVSDWHSEWPASKRSSCRYSAAYLRERGQDAAVIAASERLIAAGADAVVVAGTAVAGIMHRLRAAGVGAAAGRDRMRGRPDRDPRASWAAAAGHRCATDRWQHRDRHRSIVAPASVALSHKHRPG